MVRLSIITFFDEHVLNHVFKYLSFNNVVPPSVSGYAWLYGVFGFLGRFVSTYVEALEEEEDDEDE